MTDPIALDSGSPVPTYPAQHTAAGAGLSGAWRSGLILAATLVVSVCAGLGYWQANRPDDSTLARTSTPDASVDKTASSRRVGSTPTPVDTAPAAATAAAPPWPLWEFRLREPIPPRNPPLTPPPWRLIGASGGAGAWQLIVLREGKNEPEYFRVGDKLPGNYRIEAITEEDVTLRHGRREMVLSYFASR